MNKDTKLELRQTQWTLVKKGDPIFDESAWVITIIDESGGEFVEVHGGLFDGKIRINPEEWADLGAAISEAILECRESETNNTKETK